MTVNGLVGVALRGDFRTSGTNYARLSWVLVLRGRYHMVSMVVLVEDAATLDESPAKELERFDLLDRNAPLPAASTSAVEL